jgi:hypothetical protein
MVIILITAAWFPYSFPAIREKAILSGKSLDKSSEGNKEYLNNTNYRVKSLFNIISKGVKVELNRIR